MNSKIKYWLASIMLLSSLATPIQSFYSSAITAKSSVSITSELEVPIPKLYVDGKIVEEDIENGSFEIGISGWHDFGEVEVLEGEIVDTLNIGSNEGVNMIRLGSPTTNFTLSRITQSIPAKAKNLQLSYYLVSTDYYPFDSPAFLIRINGHTLYQADTRIANPGSIPDGKVRGAGWQTLSFSLDQFDADRLTLEVVLSNNGDSDSPTWVYIDDVTTNLAVAKQDSDYLISSGSYDSQYRIDNGDWISGNQFSIPLSGLHTVDIRSVGVTGNTSRELSKQVYIDGSPPFRVEDLLIEGVGKNYISLSWTPLGEQNENLISTIYYQKDCDVASDFALSSSTIFDETKLVGTSGITEVANIVGLEADTSYCFAAIISDPAKNLSNISNMQTTRTSSSTAEILPGDLIINELMWMGSTSSDHDEWLELRNLTDHSLDLSSLKLTYYRDLAETEMDIDFTGHFIQPRSYFVIANYDLTNSALKHQANLVDPSLVLHNGETDINLYAGDLLLDSISYIEPPAGLNDISGSRRWSAQRAFGSYPITELNWYTTIDPLTEFDFFTAGGNRGTPNSNNR